MHIAIIGNQDFSLLKFRLALVKDLIRQGATVYTFVPKYSAEAKEQIKELGAIPIEYDLSRTGMNPFKDIPDIVKLSRLLKKYQITHTFSYFIKPVIYGSIAAKMAGVKNIYSMIGGLGYIYTDESIKTQKGRMLRSVVNKLYKLAFSFNKKVFIQNPDDIAYFIANKVLPVSKAVRTYGSGVELEEYPFSEAMGKPVTFVLISRMIQDKGILEFVEAAKLIKNKYPATEFKLIGGLDSNPRGISERQLKTWTKEGVVNWIGHVPNVKKHLEEASVFVLPSYYREGTPRSVLEAMSIGRPIITTHNPGCKETVKEGYNGYLVPVKKSESLYEAMLKFIQNPELITTMGRNSRQMAEELYDVNKINKVILENMGLFKLTREDKSETFTLKESNFAKAI